MKIQFLFFIFNIRFLNLHLIKFLLELIFLLNQLIILKLHRVYLFFININFVILVSDFFLGDIQLILRVVQVTLQSGFLGLKIQDGHWICLVLVLELLNLIIFFIALILRFSKIHL